MDNAEKPIPTLADFEEFVRALGEAVQGLKPDSVGRQRDSAADLVYAGYVLLLQYEDAGTPGVVYTANPSRWHVKNPALARFQARRDLVITNGIVGPRAEIAAQFLEHFGELRPILGILAALGKLPLELSALLPVEALGARTPGQVLDQLLGRRTA